MSEHLERVSFWFDSLDRVPEPEPPGELPGKVDVAIVGGGFTGLWTAYYLKTLQPDLDIAVLEAVTVGFGASGRNGGWCMGLAEGVGELLDDPERREAGVRMLRAMMATVDEVGRVCQAENIDCHYAKGGTLSVATAPFAASRLQRRVQTYAERGLADYCQWLPEAEAQSRIGCERNYGAAYTPHCAAIHPARLVRGLGEAVRRRGVTVCESTPVVGIEGGTVKTGRGDVRADTVIRATEGYTDSIAGHRRQLMPLYSMIVATEPLPDGVWEQLGLHNRETFDDQRRLTIYGQRTADGRLAFGGREGYRFGSKRVPFLTPENNRFEKLEAAMREMFPVLEGRAVTHRWGGLMGVPTHWRPSVNFDPATGFGTAGGYVGEGVGASNLAGRTMADLVLGRDTDLARLPWVGDVSGKWPPEPLRWLGAQAFLSIGSLADRSERLRGRPSKFWGRLFGLVDP